MTSSKFVPAKSLMDLLPLGLGVRCCESISATVASLLQAEKVNLF